MLDLILLTFLSQKISDKRELKQIAINDSSAIKTEDSINIYRERNFEPCSFVVNNTMLASDNPLRFGKLFLEYNKSHDN